MRKTSRSCSCRSLGGWAEGLGRDDGGNTLALRGWDGGGNTLACLGSEARGNWLPDGIGGGAALERAGRRRHLAVPLHVAGCPVTPTDGRRRSNGDPSVAGAHACETSKSHAGLRNAWFSHRSRTSTSQVARRSVMTMTQETWSSPPHGCYRTCRLSTSTIAQSLSRKTVSSRERALRPSSLDHSSHTTDHPGSPGPRRAISSISKSPDGGLISVRPYSRTASSISFAVRRFPWESRSILKVTRHEK